MVELWQEGRIAMRSLEKSHRNADMDQADPEHINRETTEFSWDDLKTVPFSGDRQQLSENANAAESLKDMIDSLPVDEEMEKTQREEDARRRVQDVFRKMNNAASFGENVHGNKSRTQEASKNDDRDQDLLSISNSF